MIFSFPTEILINYHFKKFNMLIKFYGAKPILNEVLINRIVYFK